MTEGVAVCDSSSLIIFWQIGRLELLRGVFEVVIVPSAVKREIAPSLGRLPFWVSELAAPTPPEQAMALGPGEREAIALALSLHADYVIVDELLGRRVARHLGLEVIGAVGLLVRARQHGLVDAVRPELDAMIAAGFYVSRQLYEETLVTAGEMHP
jgi:uncharacterized protein